MIYDDYYKSRNDQKRKQFRLAASAKRNTHNAIKMSVYLWSRIILARSLRYFLCLAFLSLCVSLYVFLLVPSCRMSEEESGDDDSQVSDSQLVCVLDAKNRLIFPAFLPYHCLLYKFLYIRGPNIR